MLIAVYWSKRKESRQEAAMRLNAYFSGLKKHSSLLNKWYERGGSKPEALSRPLDVKSLATALQDARNDRNGIIPELGYKLSTWNGRDTPHGASLSVSIGLYSDRVPNRIVLSLDPQVLTIAESKHVFDRMIALFTPDRGIIKDQQEAIREQYERSNF